MSWTLEPQTQKQPSTQGKWTLQSDAQTEQPQKEEGYGEWALRLGTMGVSAVGERVAGLPGDIREGIQNLAIAAYEKPGFGLDPKTTKGYDENKSFFDNFIEVLSPPPKEKERDAPDWLKEAFSTQTKILPTSQDVRQKAAEVTGGFTEPKNKGEEIYRQFVSDVADLTAIPAPYRMSLARRAGVALGSELLGEGAKAITGKESDKQKTKAGSMFLLSMFNPGGARQAVSNMYQDVRNRVPQNAFADVAHFEQRLQNFENQTMRSGIQTESNRGVMRDTRDLIERIRAGGGNMPIHAVLDAKHNINENRARFFATTVNDMERRTGRRLYGQLSNIIDDMAGHSLQSQGYNAEHQIFNNANQAWRTMHQAADASRFVRRIIPSGMRGSAMSALFEIATAHPSLAIKTGTALASGIGMITGARLLTQVMNSPTLRRHYLTTLSHAMAGNSKATLESWNELNRAWKLEKNQ